MSRRTWSRSLSALACVALVAAASPAAVAVSAPAPTLVPTVAVDNPDGTHTITVDLAGDTWVSNSGQTTSQSTSPELRVGSNNLGLVKARSYLDFDYTALAGIPAGAVVTSADLTLSNFLTGSCAGTAIRASRITGAWTVAGLKWSAQPAATTVGSGASTASYGAAACPTESDVTFDVKGIVTTWLSGAAERGIQIKADKEGASTGYRKYRSAESGDATKAPTLTVTYDSYPSTAKDLVASPGNAPFVTSLTPTFTATVADPDGGPVRGYFEVRKGTTPTSPIVWTGSSTPVESGGKASITMPGGVLVDGTVYSVAAWSQDAALKSQTPIALGFKTDVTAPTVAITSNVFTDGQWKNPMPSSATFTFNGPADTSGFHIVFDGTVLPDAAADGSGDFTSSWTPTAGWHTIEVTPADDAGNVGGTTTFSFGTGTPAFELPTEWEGSTGDFPVSMSASPNATKAALLWRVVGETTWHTAAQVSYGGSSWDGSVVNNASRSTTGLLTWHATAETLGTGTLTAPALIQVRGCFQYPSTAIACTADRFVQLVEEPEE